MSSDRIIVEAIKAAQDLLSQNLPPAHNLTDAATVMRFRELIRSQAIRSALERGSDTLFAFALRAVERVTSDHSQANRQTINRLWEVLDDPHLNKALGNPPNRRKMLGLHGDIDSSSLIHTNMPSARKQRSVSSGSGDWAEFVPQLF